MRVFEAGWNALQVWPDRRRKAGRGAEAPKCRRTDPNWADSVAQRPTKFYYPLEMFSLFYGVENALAGADWVAGGLGFEPRQAESEFAVLPLDDPPKGSVDARLANTPPACKVRAGLASAWIMLACPALVRGRASGGQECWTGPERRTQKPARPPRCAARGRARSRHQQLPSADRDAVARRQSADRRFLLAHRPPGRGRCAHRRAVASRDRSHDRRAQDLFGSYPRQGCATRPRHRDRGLPPRRAMRACCSSARATRPESN